MSAFVVPEPILAQAWRIFTEAGCAHGDLAVAFADALTAVAPLIVAEELRFWHAMIQDIAEAQHSFDTRNPFLLVGARLAFRIHEIDPPGGAP